jgi:dihydrolipoamide dehydrogenase
MAAMDAAHDLVVLGAGSGGYAAALRAAELGLRVALVEKDLVGGTCLHRGCIPAKAILHAAEIADAARDAGRFGVHATLERVDAAEVRAYADAVVAKLHKGLTGLIGSRGIAVVRGEGRLVPTRDGLVVNVGEDRHSARWIVLATGSLPRTLPGVTVDGERVLTSEHALRLERLPSSAIVLGGGVIGVEFASAWRSFGVDVTIVEALPRLVPTEEPEASAALARAFRGRGISVVVDAPVEACGPDSDGVLVRLANGRELRGEVVLVAVGRGPVSAGLGFEEAGVELDRGFVVTNERLETAAPGVHAVGDLVPGLQLAHRGFAHGIFVAEEIAHRSGRLDRPPVPVRDRDVPRVTYSDPEVASIGLGEATAREKYGEVETFRYDLAGNGRSQILRTSGFVKLVRRPGGPVVGIHVVGARAGELIAEAQLITNWEAHPSDVAGLIHAHPTQGEAIGEAHLALAGKPLHLHG